MPLRTRASSLSLLAIALAAASCHRRDDTVVPLTDPDWIKLTVPLAFPTSDEVYALAGDLDQTLLVATKTTVFTTSDKGQTWQKSKDFGGPMPCLLQRQDTILAFNLFGRSTPRGEHEAKDAHYFTRDFGKTWVSTRSLPNAEHYLNLGQTAGRLQAAGVTYFLQGNSIPDATTSGQLLLATDLYRTSASGTTTVRLPARHYLNNLHFDGQHRLYVAASGLAFDPITQQAIDPTLQKQGIVYISRQPFPQ
jgi:hypothetical protein